MFVAVKVEMVASAATTVAGADVTDATAVCASVSADDPKLTLFAPNFSSRNSLAMILSATVSWSAPCAPKITASINPPTEAGFASPP